MLGAYYFDENVRANYTFSQYVVNVFQDLKVGTTSYAGFGRVVLNASDRFRLIGGARYTKDDKSFDVIGDTVSNICTTPGGPGGPGGGAGPGAGGQRGPGGGFGGGGQGGGGRLNVAVYHTVHLTDSVTLRDGLPVVDLLRGGTIGSGGQPRHEVEVQAGISKNGFGARLTGDWRSATRVTGLFAADDLRFSSLATVNLRLFANVGQMPWAIKSAPWLRGTRISLGVSNLFDARQRVTDGAGATPLSYQPGYLDPFGRTVRISIRKMLF